MPAHFMLVEGGQVRTERYWNLNSDKSKTSQKISDNEAKAKLDELLDQSIQGRLISDVPHGIFLSGGIDSSLISAIAAKHVSQPLKTFSIGFAEESYDETVHAKTVADHLGASHEVIPFHSDIVIDTIEKLFEVLDEPTGDPATIPTFLLSHHAKQSVSVVLAGEGGDEPFGGYRTYKTQRQIDQWNLIPTHLRPQSNIFKPFMSKPSFKDFIKGAGVPPVERHLHYRSKVQLETQTKILNDEILQAAPFASREEVISHIDLAELVESSQDAVDLLMRLDTSTYLADGLLFKMDRATMATSLEGRLPFLAYPVVEFAFSLSSWQKVRISQTKHLLRKLAADYLPPSIVNRPKKGFDLPIAMWFNNELRPLVDEYINEEFVVKQNIFHWQPLKMLLDEHRSGAVSRRSELWTILMFQRWWSKYFSERNCASAAPEAVTAAAVR